MTKWLMRGEIFANVLIGGLLILVFSLIIRVLVVVGNESVEIIEKSWEK